MYTLYAEDTSSNRHIVKVKDLRSTRFSRAMREARGEPSMQGCRLFVAEPDGHGAPVEGTYAYLDRPATASNQALNRAALQRVVSNVSKTMW